MHLAIDTSTDNASFAFVNGNAVIFELSWKCARNHTVEFLPRLQYLMNQHCLDVKDIDGLSVALGPGSFSGTRVGLSIAKGLAYSLNIPLAGFSSLEVEAYPFAITGFPICAIHNAGRGELAVALYRTQNDDWKQIKPEHLTTLEVLINETAEKTIFCGELTDSEVEEIRLKLRDNVVIPTFSSRLRRAAFLAELGQKRLAEGKVDNPAKLQPIYLRRPAISKPKKEYRGI